MDLPTTNLFPSCYTLYSRPHENRIEVVGRCQADTGRMLRLDQRPKINHVKVELDGEYVDAKDVDIEYRENPFVFEEDRGMDEGTVLHTYGVATCHAYVAMVETEGRCFRLMAHFTGLSEFGNSLVLLAEDFLDWIESQVSEPILKSQTRMELYVVGGSMDDSHDLTQKQRALLRADGWRVELLCGLNRTSLHAPDGTVIDNFENDDHVEDVSVVTTASHVYCLLPSRHHLNPNSIACDGRRCRDFRFPASAAFHV